ncbi:MAG: hypothetical protein GTN89_05590 [Acidobacteria bacterium]|nr:hypothetical protein [Acidobacteriota bacterium]NIM61351.1 hypothetical protein [Acidobacteriota bacterium]NIO58797.1 hypothetical protein [Acidobacteriota bacterium]NIQ29840.1 hypothetical protein [Acidobacteriota bacterium]NIQ84565.1 hypothetical protein [Acidobacteriota bacterium]
MRRAYENWVADYRSYAQKRGFRTFNDWPYHRRGFIEAWAQPGFHHFWQVWNPGIGYFTYRCYLVMGGRRHRFLTTMAAFVACGLVHSLIVFPFLGWSYSIVVAFTCFGLLANASRGLAPLLRQERWPAAANVLINVLFVLASFDLGFSVNRVL